MLTFQIFPGISLGEEAIQGSILTAHTRGGDEYLLGLLGPRCTLPSKHAAERASVCSGGARRTNRLLAARAQLARNAATLSTSFAAGSSMLSSGPPELAGSSVLSFESTSAEQQVEGDDRRTFPTGSRVVPPSNSPSDPTPLPSAEAQSSHVAATELLAALLERLHMMLMGGGGSPVRSGADKLAVAASAVLV